MTDHPPSTDRYDCQDLLGEGGMGRVWRAWDRLLEREVALKEPRGSAGGAAAARLEREASVLHHLDHAGVVTLLDRGRFADGRPFLVMRLVEGEALHTWGREAALGATQRTWVFRGVVAAVAHAHAQGVVHRDLKPDNVRVAGDGMVTVLDWGLARLLQETRPPAATGPALTRVGARVGTPAYMSPEQAAGEEVGPEADVWSLGILLWELLAQRRAYAGRAATEVLAGVLSGPPPLLSSVVPSVPAELADLCTRALSGRSVRPADAGALLSELDDVLRVLDRAPVAPAARPRGLVLGVGAGTALGGLVLGLALRGGGPPEAPRDPLDAVVIEALVDSGREEQARAAACARLAVDPADPVARGALLRAVPPAEPVWSMPAPQCTIGSVMRWDGRLLACASEGETSLWRLDRGGAQEVWRRDEEVHELVFTGKEGLVAHGPHQQTLLRRRVEDGRPVDIISSHLRGARLVESRAEDLARGKLGGDVLRERWLHGWERKRTVSSQDVALARWTPSAPVRGAVVLPDRRELQLLERAVVRTTADGRTVVDRWPIPASAGVGAALAVSATARFVLVRTTLGHAAVLDVETGSWSPWTPLALRDASVLAVSPDGARAAAAALGQVQIWSPDQPGIKQQVQGLYSHVAFLDDRHLFVGGPETMGLWAVAGPTEAPSLDLDEPVHGLVWDELGLVAWGRSSAAVLFDPAASTETDPPATLERLVSAAGAPDGPGLAIARGEQGLELWGPAGRRRVDQACELVAWPAPGLVVCATDHDGPFRVDVATGRVDRTENLPRQRWASIGAGGGRTVLMDWETRFFELGPDGLQHRSTVPWANRARLAGGDRYLLLNGRRGLMRREWRAGDASTDTLLVPTGFRSSAYVSSPSGGLVATALPNGGFRVDAVDGSGPRIVAAAGHDRYLAVAWSPDETRLAVGDVTGLVRIFDLSQPACGGVRAAQPGGPIGTGSRGGDTPAP